MESLYNCWKKKIYFWIPQSWKLWRKWKSLNWDKNPTSTFKYLDTFKVQECSMTEAWPPLAGWLAGAFYYFASAPTSTAGLQSLPQAPVFQRTSRSAKARTNSSPWGDSPCFTSQSGYDSVIVRNRPQVWMPTERSEGRNWVCTRVLTGEVSMVG